MRNTPQMRPGWLLIDALIGIGIMAILMVALTTAEAGFARVSHYHLARQRCLADDLCRELVVRQAAAGEDRQLLPAHEGVHAVDRRHAGLNAITRVGAPYRVDGLAVDVAPVLGQRRRQNRPGTTALRRPEDLPGGTAHEAGPDEHGQFN